MKKNLDDIFTPKRILEYARFLLQSYMTLRHSDLEEWADDSEAWLLEVGGDVVSAESGLRVNTSSIAPNIVCRRSFVHGPSK